MCGLIVARIQWVRFVFVGECNLFDLHSVEQGSCGKVIGHWEVDFNEPECTPSWGQIADKVLHFLSSQDLDTPQI
jgi:hypothetical protein